MNVMQIKYIFLGSRFAEEKWKICSDEKKMKIYNANWGTKCNEEANGNVQKMNKSRSNINHQESAYSNENEMKGEHFSSTIEHAYRKMNLELSSIRRILDFVNTEMKAVIR